MSHPKKFRFGVEMLKPFQGMSWAESAQFLEDLGYSTLFVSDHFNEGFGPIVAMAVGAAATKSLRVASAVIAPDFRHPAVIARELASIDLISQGRLEVGIGAGYMVSDYETTGIQMDPPGIRVERMMEYVAVLRGLFGEEKFSFEGKHYHISQLECVPHVYTKDGPPILIAGGGKRMLTFAAIHADIIGVNTNLPSSKARAASIRDAVPSSIDEKLSWIREAAGARFADIELHAWVKFAKVTDSSHSIIRELTDRFDASEEEVRSSPKVLLGSVSEIVERVQALRERWGYSYFTVQQPASFDFAEVIAQLPA